MRPGWNRITRAMTQAERQLVCQHVWKWSGPAAAESERCERPSKMVCLECDSWFVKPCGIAQSRRCTYCAEIKRGDVAAVGRSGWSDHAGTAAVWLTLTAPGADRLPFDRSLCTHGPGVRCAGALGCQVEATLLALWHARLPLAWSHFVTEVRRSLNKGCSGPPSSWPVQVEFFKTYEPQERLALHIHAMVRVTGVVSGRRFQAACRRAKHLNGFGPQMKAELVDISDPVIAARVAGYCAKYTSKASDRLPDVKRLDIRTGEVLTGGMRAWSSSRRWGLSMAQVRTKRVAWCTANAAAPALGSLLPTTGVTPPGLTCSAISTQTGPAPP